GQSLVPIDQKIPMIDRKDAGEGIFGKPRDEACDEQDDDFEEADGEGIAVAGDYVYIIGSHSCSGKGKYKPSSYLITRRKLAGGDTFLIRDPDARQRTWRGADMLVYSDVGDAYGKPKKKGTNIEGVAVIGDHLYAGLRTPVDGKEAYLVRAP